MVEEYDLSEFRSTLFNLKPYEALLALKNQELYGAEVAKATNTTYSHAVQMLSRFNEHDLVNKRRQGRCTYYTLNEKGRALAEKLENIESFMVPESDFNSTGPDTGGSLQQCSVSSS